MGTKERQEFIKHISSFLCLYCTHNFNELLCFLVKALGLCPDIHTLFLQESKQLEYNKNTNSYLLILSPRLLLWMGNTSVDPYISRERWLSIFYSLRWTVWDYHAWHCWSGVRHCSGISFLYVLLKIYNDGF